MRGGVLFGSGALVGVMLMQLGAAQSNDVRTLNHVGMVVKNYEAAFDFYTKTMGFREAYTIKNDDGSVRLTYLQLNKNTFVELIPAGPNQPASRSATWPAPWPRCASAARRSTTPRARRRRRCSRA